MFDGLKITFRDQQVVAKLRRNPRFEFVHHVNSITGEILNHTAEYRGLKIKTYVSGLVEIQGSLHKFYNGGVQNYDSFTRTKLIAAIDQLKNELEIEPRTALLNNLEFGANINTAFAANELINGLLCYKWHPFSTMQVRGQGFGKECKSFGQYYVKIYNKGLQYDQPGNILRVEKKIVTMAALKFGVIHLSDLTNPALWRHCRQQVVEMVEHILINEPIEIELLKKNEQRIYNTVVNQSKWANFSRDQRKRYKQAFNKIICVYGREKYRPTILNQIDDKVIELVAT